MDGQLVAVVAVQVERPPRLADDNDGRDSLWDSAPPIPLCFFHARSGSHRPATEVRLLWDCAHLYVRFDVADAREEMVARYIEPNSPSYTDSCVELFLKAHDDAYANIEINCLGAILLQTHVAPRQGTSVDPTVWDAQIERWTSVSKEMLASSDASGPFSWSVCVRLPHALLSALLPRLPPPTVRNTADDDSGWWVGLYKCADDSPHPHWASAHDIGEALDFHQPSRFSRLVFVHDLVHDIRAASVATQTHAVARLTTLLVTE
jgi:hypothetical protein